MPATSSRIQVLPDLVINKIAAGEVVERPAAVVKELVENAIDAGARRIEVESVGGGARRIAVTDDGAGMTRDEALLALERHATSKIRDVADLDDIHTLGFRGEALAAIASVSRFTLTTRRAEDDGGTRVRLAGGKILSVEACGAPPGTAMEVQGLFFNVPARRKFLRAESTETAHIRRITESFALAYPGVGFRLRLDGREVMRFPPGATREERIRELFDPAWVEALRPVEGEEGPVKVEGFITLPTVQRADRNDIYTFVNGRPAQAALLHYAIAAAGEGMWPRQRHPAGVLHVTCPGTQVDVNVHPTKREVRFRDPTRVRDLVIRSLRRALEGEVPAPAVAASPGPPSTQPPPPPLPAYQEMLTPRRPDPTHGASAPEPSADASGPGLPDVGVPWQVLRVLGQIEGGYAVLETEDGLVLLDPQAAHERVLYERFLERGDARPPVQRLLTPHTVDLDAVEAARVRAHLDLLQEMGIGVSAFGGDSFLIDALPAPLSGASPEALLHEVALELEQTGAAKGAPHRIRAAVARAAATASSDRSRRLGEAELQAVLEALVRARMPYTCPHGRPTVIQISRRELDRKFGRG